jgi:hypothetical protein
LFPCRNNVRHRTETKAWFWNCPPEATNNAGPLHRQEGNNPVTHRFSKAGMGTAFSALLVGSALLFVASAPAEAAPKERSRAAADLKMARSKIAQADPATTSSISKTASDEQPACDRPRRRLWVEGEGWVVRRVSACH